MPTGEGQPPTDLDTGEVLNGAWRLEEKIGEGGMGRVFRATDLKLARKAAVKALSVNNLDDETVKRFEREAQVMGKLDHPGVVTLYGVGRTRGVPWLAMKHLEGRSLWGVLDENNGLLSAQLLLPIARQLLEALGYIHGRGLLHRDLKPSNIHIGYQGKATLLDLGLARGHKSALTRTGVIWGTPDYMAPEQIVGERQLDGRADLYSFSVVLYRMMSGTSPFPEEDEHELMRAHLMNPRPDISRAVPSLSPLLGAALQKGLAIRPEDRFQTADEMLVALERAMVAAPREAATSVRASGSNHPALPRRRPTGESPVVDITPKSGARRVSDPNLPATVVGVAPKRRIISPSLARPEVVTDPSVPARDGPSGPTVVVMEPDLQDAIRRASLQDDDEEDLNAARTQREGFQPLVTHREGFRKIVVEEESGPREGPTAPSEPHALPLPEAVSQNTGSTDKTTTPLPAYLSPPYLIGGAVVLLLLGVLLGKLL